LLSREGRTTTGHLRHPEQLPTPTLDPNRPLLATRIQDRARDRSALRRQTLTPGLPRQAPATRVHPRQVRQLFSQLTPMGHLEHRQQLLSTPTGHHKLRFSRLIPMDRPRHLSNQSTPMEHLENRLLAPHLDHSQVMEIQHLPRNPTDHLKHQPRAPTDLPRRHPRILMDHHKPQLRAPMASHSHLLHRHHSLPMEMQPQPLPLTPMDPLSHRPQLPNPMDLPNLPLLPTPMDHLSPQLQLQIPMDPLKQLPHLTPMDHPSPHPDPCPPTEILHQFKTPTDHPAPLHPQELSIPTERLFLARLPRLRQPIPMGLLFQLLTPTVLRLPKAPT